MKWIALFSLSVLASHVAAQSIEQSPDQQILSMSSVEVDATMQQMAAAVNQSAPIQTDAATQIVGAVYIKPSRIFNYRVKLLQHRSAQQAAQSMKPSFCSGRTNLAFMAKGISYQYSVSTPSETFNITFRRADCP